MTDIVVCVNKKEWEEIIKEHPEHEKLVQDLVTNHFGKGFVVRGIDQASVKPPRRGFVEDEGPGLLFPNKMPIALGECIKKYEKLWDVADKLKAPRVANLVKVAALTAFMGCAGACKDRSNK